MSVSTASADGIRRLRAAATDRRCANIRYRQRQLESLHNGLHKKVSAICAAITIDTQNTNTEVVAEFFMAMTAIKYFHDSLNFEKELKDEYSTVAGNNYDTRRTSVGLVLVRPTYHTRFYSILSPAAAAIAAGNCVVIELESNILEIDSLLKVLLTDTLDHDTFFISHCKVPDLELDSCTLVDQNSYGMLNTLSKDVISSAKARTIAVIDRTANIDDAARAVITARFCFQGTSPYAPDLVIVNEFVKKEFIEACMRYASRIFAVQTSSAKSFNNANEAVKKAIKEGENKGQLSTFGSANFMFVDITERDSPVAGLKITGRYLAIMSCTSITDAIFSQAIGTTFLAGYFFANLESGKFMSQYLDCHIACMNRIPSHLLVGPAAPIAYAPSFIHRYSTDMFSVSRPQYVKFPPGATEQVSKILEESEITSIVEISSLAVQRLVVQKQALGKATGFFEQGFQTGAGIILSFVLPALGFGTYILGKKGYEIVMRRR